MAKIDDMRQLAAIQDEALKRHAERSLRAFVAQAWPVLEPRTPFLPNWHIDLICEYLEAITAGDLRRLVINLPPRYMKSLLVTVFWPAWEWLRMPETRWLFVSYSESLATDHSVNRRQLLQSPWYRDSWGDRFQLTSDQNEENAIPQQPARHHDRDVGRWHRHRKRRESHHRR